jgi:signal transduction histidine kinase
MAVRRLPRRAEAWLRIAAVAAAVVLLVVSLALGAGIYRGDLVFLFLGVLAQVSALPLTLTLARPALAAPLSIVGVAVVMLAAHAQGAPWPWAVTTLLTQALVVAALGYRVSWMLGAGTLAAGVAASWLIAAMIDPAHDQQSVAVNLVVSTSIVGAALIAGIVIRERESIRRQLARERRVTAEEHARRLVAEEKTRIARELHDVIAHHMSTITVQATSAPYRHPHADTEIRQEFADIAASSRRALGEMRSLLGVLRDPDAPSARAPLPRLSGIVELVAQARRSGLTIELRGAESLTDDGIDEAIGLAAYRIVQEAVSNVMRHARSADAEVLARRDDALDLVVRNGPGDVAARGRNAEIDQDPGSGLIGMRDRATSVGGSLTAGRTADGGYEVHAALPLRPPDHPTGDER